MKQKQIKEESDILRHEIKSLRDELEDATRRLRFLQKNCTHETADEIGNDHNDTYFECNICGKMISY